MLSEFYTGVESDKQHPHALGRSLWANRSLIGCENRQIVDMLLGDTTTQQWLEVAAEEPEFRNDLRDHVSAFKHAHNRTFRHDDCRNGKKLGNRGGRKMSTAQT